MSTSGGHPRYPDHPVFEGRESCIRNGRQLNWSNCTPAGFAMQVSIATGGRYNPSACSVRIATGDTIGGTTIPQCAAAIREEWGVATEVRVGSNVASPRYGITKLRAGCALNLQGNCDALIDERTLSGQRLRSTKGAVNHDVILVEGRGWYLRDGVWWPREVLVYDPAADGRSVAWGSGHAALGPDWWPLATVLEFAANLRPASPDGGKSGARLGGGRWYCAIGPDTNPHVHLRYNPGTTRTSPFPKPLVAAPLSAGRRVGVRTGPGTRFPRVVTGGTPESLSKGQPFTAYQQHGDWYGSHNGARWVPINRMAAA